MPLGSSETDKETERGKESEKTTKFNGSTPREEPGNRTSWNKLRKKRHETNFNLCDDCELPNKQTKKTVGYKLHFVFLLRHSS